MDRPLTRIFRIEHPAALTGEDADGSALERAIADLAARAVRERPALAPYVPALVRQLAAQLPEDAGLEALARVDAGDLLVASAVLAGSRDAFAVLEAEYLPASRRALQRLGVEGADLEDLLQQVRAHVLAPRDRAPPALATYAGRGSLEGWLRLVAVRLGRRTHGPRRLEVPADDEAILDALVPPSQARGLESAVRQAVGEVVREVVRALPPDERLLLAQRFADGLRVEELGLLYDVHNATISRRIAAVCARVRAQVSERLSRELGIGTPTLDSLLSTFDGMIGEAPTSGAR